MSTNAAYASTPRYAIAECSVANANFDGTGTIVTLFTAGSNGSRVDDIGWAAQGNTTAGCLKFFSRESSLVNWKFVFCLGVDARSVSATSFPWQGGVRNANWIMEPGNQLGIAPHNGESFIVHITNAGDF